MVNAEDSGDSLRETTEELKPPEDQAGTQEAESVERALRQAGFAKSKILWISPDFDEPLEEFREYME